MSATGSTSALSNLRATLIKAVTAIVVIWLLSWVFGRALGPFVAVAFFVGLLSLTLAVTRVGEFSTPFAISAVVMAGILMEVASMFLPVDGFLTDVFGPTIASLDGWLLAFYGAVAISVYWILDIRILSAFRRESGRPEAANAATVARAFQRRAASLSDQWRGVLAAFVFLLFILANTVFGFLGDAGSQIFAELAKVPALSGFGAFLAISYTNMGGHVPVLSGLPLFGTLSAGEVLAIGLAILALVYFAKRGR